MLGFRHGRCCLSCVSGLLLARVSPRGSVDRWIGKALSWVVSRGRWYFAAAALPRVAQVESL